MMTVVHAHKGAQMYVTKFTGFEAHSSMTHLGVSAIHFAGEFVHYLNTRAGRARRAKAPPTSEFMPAGADLQRRHHRRRHRGQHPGARVRGAVGLSRAARPSRSRRWASARWQWLKDELLPKMKAKHPAAAIDTVLRSSTAGLLAGGQRGGQGAGRQLVGLQHRGQRGLRHRGRHLPQDARRADRGLRPGRHRPGAPAQRVHPRLADHACEGFMRRMVEWASQ